MESDHVTFWSNIFSSDHDHLKKREGRRKAGRKGGRKSPERDTQAQGSVNLAQLLVFMLSLLRQYAKICPSPRTLERWESSVVKSAEGRESGHSPKARRELPQVSCACSEETCFSRRACTSWRETETQCTVPETPGSYRRLVEWRQPSRSTARTHSSIPNMTKFHLFCWEASFKAYLITFMLFSKRVPGHQISAPA